MERRVAANESAAGPIDLTRARDIHGLADALEISLGRAERWFHLGLAPCTARVEVSVPRVGFVSARRWSEADIDLLRARRGEILQREAELQAFRQRCTAYGRALVRARIAGSTVDAAVTVATPDWARVGRDGASAPVPGVAQTVRALLREHQRWACGVLLELGLAPPDLLGEMRLFVEWKQISAYAHWRSAGLAVPRSRGGVDSQECPHYRIAAAQLVPDGLLSEEFDRKDVLHSEYDFLGRDREIGAFARATVFDRLLIVQLHEIAHAVQHALLARGLAIPQRLLEAEIQRRSDAHVDEEKGHGAMWSALYRVLRRQAGYVRR